MNQAQYTPQVDTHIYLPIYLPFKVKVPHCSTPAEWAALAIAALDQAGMGVKDQDRVEKLVKGILGL